jgi:hypothetical protein
MMAVKPCKEKTAETPHARCKGCTPDDYGDTNIVVNEPARTVTAVCCFLVPVVFDKIIADF